MSITDARVLQELLAATESEREPLAWRNAGGRCISEINGVRLELFTLRSLGAERLCLCMSFDGHNVYLEQPRDRTLFRKHYRTDHERRVAALFTALARAAMPATAESWSQEPPETDGATPGAPATLAR